MAELKFDPKKGIWAEEIETVEKLTRDFFGKREKNIVRLMPEEAMYLMLFRRFLLTDNKGNDIDFNTLASYFIKKEPRLFISYNAYRDWRDRGLVVRRYMSSMQGKHSKKNFKKYPSEKLKKIKIKATAYWYPDSMFSILDNEDDGKELFEKHWLGQYGV
ncbi:MAG: hypothetical protein KAS04_06490, partial [Candidatus Aenigmarchaeota archaeon]|nr:hypothetical protein [Candidatus Aenigmarchaeota archaeon]